MATVNDFKKYFDKLVSEGGGDNIVKCLYDGFIEDIEKVDDLFKPVLKPGKGVCSGEVFPGELLLES